MHPPATVRSAAGEGEGEGEGEDEDEDEHHQSLLTSLLRNTMTSH